MGGFQAADSWRRLRLVRSPSNEANRRWQRGGSSVLPYQGDGRSVDCVPGRREPVSNRLPLRQALALPWGALLSGVLGLANDREFAPRGLRKNERIVAS